MTTTINGIVAYPVTPFTDDDRIDVATLHSLLDRMIDRGVHAIAPLGSTGEAAYLSDEKWSVVAAETLQHTDGRVPTVVGVSDLTTAGAVRRAKLADELGATAVMALPASYSRPSDGASMKNGRHDAVSRRQRRRIPGRGLSGIRCKRRISS